MNCLTLNFSPDCVVEEEDWNCWFWPSHGVILRILTDRRIAQQPINRPQCHLNQIWYKSLQCTVIAETKFMKELHKLIRDIFPKGKFQNKMYETVELSDSLLLRKLNVCRLAPVTSGVHVVSTGAVNQASQQSCRRHFSPPLYPSPSLMNTVATRPLVPWR